MIHATGCHRELWYNAVSISCMLENIRDYWIASLHIHHSVSWWSWRTM